MSLANVKADEVQRSAPYIYCNVYTSVACFGITSGDKLTFEILGDYVMYTILFNFGAEAKVYVGFHPDIPEDWKTTFSKCDFSNHFKLCRWRANSASETEVVAMADEKRQLVHIVVKGRDQMPSRVASFLSNFRPCLRAGETLTCGG